MKKIFKIFGFAIGMILISFTSFGQANAVTAKTVTASNSLTVRATRIDSISADGVFTNGNSHVLVTQSAIKAYVSPIKAVTDAITAGQLKDTTKIGFRGTGIRLGYPSAIGDSFIMKNIRTTPPPTWLLITNNLDSSVSFNVDSGTIHSYFNGFYAPIGSTGGVTKKTLNPLSANYTLLQSDSNKYITVNSASQDTVLIPDDATAAMTPPIFMEVYQLGAGKVFFKGLNSNVAVNGKGGKTLSQAQYSKIILNKVAANSWIVSGDLDTSSVAFMNTNINSISDLVTNAGTASPPDSFTVSGFNLSAGGTATAPSNFEVSLDKITYASTRSLPLTGPNFTSQPVKIYARITATAPAGNIGPSNVTITSSPASPVSVALSGVVNSLAVNDTFNINPWDSVRNGGKFVNAAWNNWAPVAPSTGLTSAALLKSNGASSTVKISIDVFNDYAANGGGFGSSNTMGYPTNVFTESLFNSSGSMNLTFSGLTAGNYKVEIVSATNGGAGPYNCNFAVGAINQSVNAFNNLGTLISLTGITVSGTTMVIACTPSNGFVVVDAIRLIKLN